MLNFSKVSRVMVVGDFMVDVNHTCRQVRVNNEGCYPLVNEDSHQVMPGGAGNVAHALLRLGVPVRLFSVVGGDIGSTSALRVLYDFGSQFENDSICLGTKVGLRRDRYYVGGRCVFRNDVDSILEDYHLPRYLSKDWIHAMEGCSAVVVVDHGKGLLTRENTEALCEGADKACVRVYLDSSSWPPAPGYKHLTMVKTGFRPETSVKGDTHEQQMELANDVAQWMEDSDTELGIVTGPSRVAGINGDNIYTMQTQKVFVTDPVGAGDQFMSVVVAGMEQLDATSREGNDGVPDFSGLFGPSNHRITELAAFAARAVVSRPTATPVSLAELQSAVTGHHYDFAVVNWPADRELVSLACETHTERGDDPIGLINGCFDLFHTGHYNLFVEAAKKNLRIVVAVNTDESVAALKGPGRPIVPLADRMKLLSAQTNVFLVIPFNTEEELRDIIRTVSPRYLLKGAEYRGKCVPGDDQEGCEVLYVKTAEPAVSTTGLIEKAKLST